ncbi:hypothetical protein EV426DRAFT_710657 [Tirmania nivea]|nr:hypothetical protein EV426DRAFT_710657 [Tirmania nivea]
MHQLTSRFILLLLFTLSAVGALPTPNPEAKNVVRENPLIQGAIPRFISKGAENPGEDDAGTGVQVKVEKDEHKEGQEEDEVGNDDSTTMVELIVVNENDDDIKREVEIKAERKSEEGVGGEEGEDSEKGEEEKIDGENSRKIDVEVEVTIENDDEGKNEVEVAVDTNNEESEKEVEVVVDVDDDNDNSEESRNEVEVVVENKSEVIVENKNEEGQNEGSSEIKVEVEVKTDKNNDEGDCEGEAEVEVIVKEAEELYDEKRDGKDEGSPKQNHQKAPTHDYEQEEASYDFKLEPEFEEEEAAFFQDLPSESDCHLASIRFNHHESNCYHYSYTNHESHPRAQFSQPENPPGEKPKSFCPGFRGVSVNVTKSQVQPAEGPLPHTLVHPSPLPQVEIHPIDVAKVEQLGQEQQREEQEQKQETEEDSPHAWKLQDLEQPENQQLEQEPKQSPKLARQAGRYPHNTEHSTHKQEQWLEQEQRGNIVAIASSQGVKDILGKRSAEPKRLPAHHVMEKHFKLAETSPHLLGVEGVDQFKDIWEKNLPYPIDGSPMWVGGPIRKRSAGRESRVVEQRQKENELRQAYGKPTKTTVPRTDNEKDIGLQEIKNEKKSLSELSNVGYKLDLGRTDEQTTLGQQQELQQQREASCNCDVCRGNAERKREKEQMRHGDAGLLGNCFSQK